MIKKDAFPRGYIGTSPGRYFRGVVPAPVDPAHRVAAWWKGRVEDGCQLTNIEDYFESYDYKGEERWKRRVRIGALYNDFVCYFGPIEYDSATFMALLYKVIGEKLRRVRGRGSMNTGRSIRIRRGTHYVEFKPLPAYRETQNLTDSVGRGIIQEQKGQEAQTD